MTSSIGPYQFTDVDTERTIRYAADELIPATDGPAVARLRQAMTKLGDDDLVAAWNGILDSHAALVSDGDAVTGSGTVTHLALGGGGVPKVSQSEIDVDYSGVVGDRQAHRVHHGAPFQALSLWSAEVIAQLQAEGHPIDQGSAGENITISGLDWSEVTVGQRLTMGTVEAQIMAFAIPCSQLKALFSDGDFNRIRWDAGPVSRMYAGVITPGHIAVGDDVKLY